MGLICLPNADDLLKIKNLKTDKVSIQEPKNTSVKINESKVKFFYNITSQKPKLEFTNFKIKFFLKSNKETIDWDFNESNIIG